MEFIGEKGQAFSTFKLLIAAIVAVVILVILLSILGYIGPPPGANQPLDGAKNALKDAYGTPTRLATTSQVVTFTKDTTLSRQAIIRAADIGISREQICLTLGDFQELTTSGFDGGVRCTNPDGDCSNENKISYERAGKKDVKISALCHTGKELPLIMEGGDPAKLIYDDIKAEWVEECNCVTDPDLEEQTCCMIALRMPPA